MNIESAYPEYFDLLKSPRTRSGYATVLRLFSIDIGKDPIAATKEDLNGYVIRLKKRNLKDATMCVYMAAIRAFYKWLVLNEKRADDPSIVFASIRLKSSPPNPKPLNDEQRATLLANLRWDTLRDKQMSLTTLIGLEIGLRRFEVCKLKWTDIDFENSRINGVGKGDRPFDLNIPAKLLEKLTEYRQFCTKSGFIGQFVFFGQSGPSKPLPYGSLWDWPAELKARCGFPKETKFSFHCTRHGFVSFVVASGKASPEEGMEMSRHSDYSTYKRYMKLNEQKLKKISNEIFG